jgi:hypothetical protein
MAFLKEKWHMFETDPWYQRLAKYSLLFSVKEGYLFARNSFGLGVHPFKTIRALLRERDYSQMLILFGFPLIWFGMGLGFIWFARRLYGATPGIWGTPTKSGVLMVSVISMSLFGYLGYWVWQVIRGNRCK